MGSYASPPAALLTRPAAGESSSGTAGTTIAQVLATGGNRLTGWTLFLIQTSTAGSTMRVVLAFTDGTESEFTTPSGLSAWFQGNQGGIVYMSDGGNNPTKAAFTNPTFPLTKKVKTIHVETAGTGGGSRVAVIAAIETEV